MFELVKEVFDCVMIPSTDEEDVIYPSRRFSSLTSDDNGRGSLKRSAKALNDLRWLV